MSVESKKITLLTKLLQIEEESLLNQINDLIDQNQPSYYTYNGSLLTANEYNNRLKKGEKEILEGNFTSHSDLEKEVENW
jgi:hypothetical protein